VNHVAYVLNDGSHSDLTTCAAMNAFLTAKGWTLNSYDGASVQSHVDHDYVFRQSSVVATPIHVRFGTDDNGLLDDEATPIPGIFHEFVEHPMTLPFRGFQNAKALFTSTASVQQQQQQSAAASSSSSES